MEAQGSKLTNKYAEGYPGKRYYGGCEFVDVIEQMAIDRAKELLVQITQTFNHAGSQANSAVYLALLSRRYSFRYELGSRWSLDSRCKS